MKFSYQTYLDGNLPGLLVGYLRGKIEITDKGYRKMICDRNAGRAA